MSNMTKCEAILELLEENGMEISSTLGAQETDVLELKVHPMVFAGENILIGEIHDVMNTPDEAVNDIREMKDKFDLDAVCAEASAYADSEEMSEGEKASFLKTVREECSRIPSALSDFCERIEARFEKAERSSKDIEM